MHEIIQPELPEPRMTDAEADLATLDDMGKELAAWKQALKLLAQLGDDEEKQS